MEVVSDVRTSILIKDDTLPGMTFFKIARSATITAEEKKIDFTKELGICLSIPKNSVNNDEQVKVFVHPAFSGPFAGPKDLEPVSPAYLIKTDNETHFQKDITVQIQHSANLLTEQDCDDLVFTRASLIPLQRGPLFGPLYVFHEVNRSKVRFSFDDGPFGEVKTNQFSLFMIMRRLWRSDDGTKLM